MNPYRAIVLSLRTLSRNRLRTCFMMLGMVVGISSLTALSSVGESTRQETMRRFKRMIGTFDTVIIRPGSGQTRGMPSLTTVPPTLKFEDARSIATDVPDVRRVAEVQNAFDVDVKYRDKTAAPAIFGVSANWTELRGDELAQGSGISDDDVRSLGRVAVLGAEVKATFFADDDPSARPSASPTSRSKSGRARLAGRRAEARTRGNLVLIPVTTASRRLFNRDFLTMFVAQLKDPEQGCAR